MLNAPFTLNQIADLRMMLERINFTITPPTGPLSDADISTLLEQVGVARLQCADLSRALFDVQFAIGRIFVENTPATILAASPPSLSLDDLAAL